ncbi:MAG: hypothetical protein LIO76_04360 [Clostridiales bacterium]|nr:hypothetical protein [Clostridiales bacterium]
MTEMILCAAVKNKRVQKGNAVSSRRDRNVSDSFWRGSYTVEAAAVVSITILILASLLIAAFYVHDRAVLQSIACESAAAAGNCAGESERNAAAASADSQVSASRFLGSRDVSGDTEADGDEAESVWNAVYPVPGFAMNYFTDNELAVQASWSCKIADPTKTIRLIRGAGELLGAEGED